MPVAVFRRYTPPTCTLELRGERSPLSVWSDRPIVKQVQFVLNIDGPQRPQEQRVTLKGGRTQLDHLHHVVDAYVQHTLGLSAQQFQTTLLQTSPSHNSTSTSTFNPAPAATGQALASPGRINDMGWARSPSPDITLVPKGLLKHELQLGALAPHPSVSSVVLNTTELFDLAHALDAYHGEVDSIPELNPVQRQGVSPWMKGAAVAVLAIGVTASLVNILQVSGPNASFETATGESASSLDAGADQQLAQRSAPTAIPSIELDDIPSANESLPPIRQRGATEKTASDADDSDTTSADVEAEAQPREAAEQEEAIAPTPTDEARLDAAQANRPDRSPQANAQPGSTATSPLGTLQPDTTLRPPAAPNALPSETAAAGTRSGPSNGNAASGVAPSSVPPAPLALEENVADFADLPPQLTSIPPIPTIESGIDPLTDAIEPSRSSVSSSNASPPSRGEAFSRENSQPDPKQPQAHSDSAETQRTEVQSYFESAWQPPDALNQSLQYRLVFNADGSLQQTIPLGESARAYRANVNLPATGDPFVSPFGGNDTPPMRLFLGANGQVRVFIESLD